MTLAYVSGPMTGYPHHNLPAFRAAVANLRAVGYDVLNPARHGADPAKTWADYLRDDLADVLRAELVVVLPGWECSRGAALGVYVAQQLGVPVVPLAVALALQP